MKVKIGKQMECKRCGFKWHARIADIRLCPACKTARFDQPRVHTRSTQGNSRVLSRGKGAKQ